MPDHHSFSAHEWPFDDAVDHGVYATTQVMEGRPILFVAHDEDTDWQFLHAADLTDDDFDDLRYVCLGCLFERHRDIAALADLPLKWEASRADVASPWIRVVSPPQGD